MPLQDANPTSSFGGFGVTLLALVLQVRKCWLVHCVFTPNISDCRVTWYYAHNPPGLFRASLMRSIRGGEVAYVFQEPMTSFSPVHTVGNQLIEAIRLHQDISKEQAAEMADYVVVMYLGQVVESAPVDEIFHAPKHPYTRALLQSIPRVQTSSGERLASITGSVPHPYDRPSGCLFHPRCPSYMQGVCDEREPAMDEVDSDHRVSCFLYHGG